MSLAKKGTRRITVNDVQYRWTVSPNDEPGIAIVIEHSNSPAQRVVAWVDHGHVISPGMVRNVIIRVLGHGWQPEKKGPEMVFRLSRFTAQTDNKGMWPAPKTPPFDVQPVHQSYCFSEPFNESTGMAKRSRY